MLNLFCAVLSATSQAGVSASLSVSLCLPVWRWQQAGWAGRCLIQVCGLVPGGVSASLLSSRLEALSG